MRPGRKIHGIITLLAIELMWAAIVTAGPDEHIVVQFSELGAIPELKCDYATTASPASVDDVGHGLIVGGFYPSSPTGNLQFILFDMSTQTVIKDILLPAAPHFGVRSSADGSVFTIEYGDEDGVSCVVSRNGEILYEADGTLLAASTDLVGVFGPRPSAPERVRLGDGTPNSTFLVPGPYSACGFGIETGEMEYLDREIVAFDCELNGTRELVIYDNLCTERWRTSWSFWNRVVGEGVFGEHKAFVLNRGSDGAEIVDARTGDILHTVVTNVSAPAFSANAMYYTATEGEHSERGNLIYYIYCVDSATGRGVRIDSYLGLAPKSIRIIGGLVVAVIGENSWEKRAHTVVYSPDLRRATYLNGYWTVSDVGSDQIRFVGAASGGPGFGEFTVDARSLFIMK